MLWDNTPVNDAVMSDRLHLGPYAGRAPELRAELSGVVLNPMIQARASLPTLLSAMGWVRGDDPERVWQDIVERRGWRGFAEAIQTCVEDLDYRRSMGEAARLRAQRYSGESMAGAAAALYRDLLATGAAA